MHARRHGRHSNWSRANGAAAPENLVALLAAAGDTLNGRTGHIVLAADTRSRDVRAVLAGEGRVTLLSAAGREVIMRHQGADSLFGDLSAIDGGRSSACISAVQRDGPQDA